MRRDQGKERPTQCQKIKNVGWLDLFYETFLIPDTPYLIPDNFFIMKAGKSIGNENNES